MRDPLAKKKRSPTEALRTPTWLALRRYFWIPAFQINSSEASCGRRWTIKAMPSLQTRMLLLCLHMGSGPSPLELASCPCDARLSEAASLTPRHVSFRSLQPTTFQRVRPAARAHHCRLSTDVKSPQLRPMRTAQSESGAIHPSPALSKPPTHKHKPPRSPQRLRATLGPFSNPPLARSVQIPPTNAASARPFWLSVCNDTFSAPCNPRRGDLAFPSPSADARVEGHRGARAPGKK